MAKFMDVHDGSIGLPAGQLAKARGRDLAIVAEEAVRLGQARLQPSRGKVFWLSTGSGRDPVMRIHGRVSRPTAEAHELAVEVQ